MSGIDSTAKNPFRQRGRCSGTDQSHCSAPCGPKLDDANISGEGKPLYEQVPCDQPRSQSSSAGHPRAQGDADTKSEFPISSSQASKHDATLVILGGVKFRAVTLNPRHIGSEIAPSIAIAPSIPVVPSRARLSRPANRPWRIHSILLSRCFLHTRHSICAHGLNSAIASATFAGFGPPTAIRSSFGARPGS